MRLTLSILFMGVLLAIPAAVLADAVFERESQNESAANRVGKQFVWPERPNAADPVVALHILSEAATATRSNVLRTTVNSAPNRPKRITHYIFLGGDRTALFDEFTLAEGRWPTAAESRDGSATVSSAGADTVGVPAVFGDRYELTIAPLRQAFESLPSPGRYVVESADPERFLAIVHQRLVEAGVTDLTIADLTSARIQAPVESGRSLKVLAYILAGLATVVIAFMLLREGKRIGVLRLVGHPALGIWYRVVGRLQVAALLIGLGACAIVALTVPGVDSLFLRLLAVTFAQVAVVGLAATVGVGLVVINRVKVSDLIKGSLQ